MIIGVDETGFFKGTNSEQFGLVTLVSVTDSEWNNFQEYVNQNFPKAFETTKGNNIAFADRVKIIKYIGRHPEIKYTTFIYQINTVDKGLVEEHQRRQAAKLQNWIFDHLSTAEPSLIDEINLLCNQINNLSESDYAKFSFITNAFIEWQQYFLFDYIYTHRTRDKWYMEHVIDTQNKPEKFRKLVVHTIQLTANGYNPGFSVKTPAEWDSTHPYLQNHAVDGDVTLQNGRIFFRNMKIGSEQTDPILFIPDLIGNTIFNSILHPNKSAWLRMLARLKQNRSLVMTQRGRDDYYYVVSGFNGARVRSDVSRTIKAHFHAMRIY